MRTTEGIFCAGVDHHATPLAAREALASLAGDRLTPHLIEHEGAEEVVLLSTCNRVEIYGRSGRRGPEIAAALGRAMPPELAEVWKQTPGVYLHEGLACWRHLSEVATGLRSMVMGEAEILGQVRAAYQSSRELGGTGKAMHGLFQSALRAARAARQAAGFGQGDPSVGRCAAEALAEFLGNREPGPLLLLGAGHTARSFGLAALEKGFRKIWVSSRTEQRAEALARDLGGETVAWSRWHEAVKASGVVVSALSGGELRWREAAGRGGPAALVDLGVPRTLTQVRAFYPEAVWVDLEELAKRSEMAPESLGAIHRAEEVLRSHERNWLSGGVRIAPTFPGGGDDDPSGDPGSRLARWQAHRVADLIRRASPGTGVELVIVRTSGDERSEFGEEAPEQPGEFSTELEKKLLQKEIDAAVHSAKDLPTHLPKGLIVAAYPERADPRDALVRRKESPTNPPAGAVVGTGSPRRDLLWRAKWKETKTRGIRGNVDRRMEKLKEDAALWGIVLASAGIDRLGGVADGLQMERLDSDWMVPAPGQGALAVECRTGDPKVRKVLEKIDDPAVRACVEAEKGFLQKWGGGCSESLGALATLQANGTLHLQAAVEDRHGGVQRAQMEGPAAEAELLGVRLAEEMRRG